MGWFCELIHLMQRGCPFRPYGGSLLPWCIDRGQGERTCVKIKSGLDKMPGRGRHPPVGATVFTMPLITAIAGQARSYRISRPGCDRL
ncbi:hypothetical protein D3C77_559220 [compost metagenome]